MALETEAKAIDVPANRLPNPTPERPSTQPHSEDHRQSGTTQSCTEALIEGVSLYARARHPRHAAGQGLGQRAKPWRRSQLVHPTLYQSAIWTKPLAGNVPVSFDSLRVLISLLRPGRVRGLAVSSAARSPLLLEQPAVAEVLSGYEVSVFSFIAVRRGTPAPIIGRLSRELAVCMREP